jgi:hypothetical protein
MIVEEAASFTTTEERRHIFEEIQLTAEDYGVFF